MTSDVSWLHILLPIFSSSKIFRLIGKRNGRISKKNKSRFKSSKFSVLRQLKFPVFQLNPPPHVVLLLSPDPGNPRQSDFLPHSRLLG